MQTAGHFVQDCHTKDVWFVHGLDVHDPRIYAICFKMENEYITKSYHMSYPKRKKVISRVWNTDFVINLPLKIPRYPSPGIKRQSKYPLGIDAATVWIKPFISLFLSFVGGRLWLNMIQHCVGLPLAKWLP